MALLPSIFARLDTKRTSSPGQAQRGECAAPPPGPVRWTSNTDVQCQAGGDGSTARPALTPGRLELGNRPAEEVHLGHAPAGVRQPDDWLALAGRGRGRVAGAALRRGRQRVEPVELGVHLSQQRPDRRRAAAAAAGCAGGGDPTTARHPTQAARGAGDEQRGHAQPASGGGARGGGSARIAGGMARAHGGAGGPAAAHTAAGKGRSGEAVHLCGASRDQPRCEGSMSPPSEDLMDIDVTMMHGCVTACSWLIISPSVRAVGLS